VVRTSSANWE